MLDCVIRKKEEQKHIMEESTVLEQVQAQSSFCQLLSPHQIWFHSLLFSKNYPADGGPSLFKYSFQHSIRLESITRLRKYEEYDFWDSFQCLHTRSVLGHMARTKRGDSEWSSKQHSELLLIDFPYREALNEFLQKFLPPAWSSLFSNTVFLLLASPNTQHLVFVLFLLDGYTIKVVLPKPLNRMSLQHFFG